jgi:hypothetical protein
MSGGGRGGGGGALLCRGGGGWRGGGEVIELLKAAHGRILSLSKILTVLSLLFYQYQCKNKGSQLEIFLFM